MRVLTPEHPLIAHQLTILRDAQTTRADFSRAMHELGLLLGVEATRGLATRPLRVETPLETTESSALSEPLPLLVPILRAGLGFLNALQNLLPDAEVGFLGMKRDEATHVSQTYATRLPATLSNRHCVVLDPMIATGGSLSAAVEELVARGASAVTVVSAVASPEGLERLKATPSASALTVVVAAVDRGLNTNAYIVPGIGDAGDRLFGETG